MKINILSTILFLCLSCFTLFAQTKKEIYCNDDIVWAGITTIDFVIAPDSTINWKTYKVSGLGSHLKQHSKDLKAVQKPLNELIINHVDAITFYNDFGLKSPLHYQMLDLSDPLHEPDYYGDKGKPYPPKAFEVFRLRCLVYYDKSTLDFKIVPQAVAVLRSTYEVVDQVFGYNILGWLPIKEWTEAMNLKDKNINFAKRFYRDIAFEDINVFKREWAINQVIENMMDSIRYQAETIVLSTTDDLDGTNLMPSSTIHHIGMDELYAMRFDSFDEKQEFAPWLGSDFKGIRLTLDWAWNKKNKTIAIKQQAFAPIHVVYDDAGEVVYYDRLFIKKTK